MKPMNERLLLGAVLVLSLVLAAATTAMAQGNSGKGGGGGKQSCKIAAELTFDPNGAITGEGVYAAEVPCDNTQMVVHFDHEVTYGGEAGGGTETGTNLGVAVDGGLAAMQPGDDPPVTKIQFSYSQGMLNYAGDSDGRCLLNPDFECDGSVVMTGAPGSRVWTITGTQGALRDGRCSGNRKNCPVNWTQVYATFEMTVTEQ